MEKNVHYTKRLIFLVKFKLHFFANFSMLCMTLVQSRYYQLQYIGFAKVMAQLSFSFMIVTLIFMSVANCTCVSLGSLLIGGHYVFKSNKSTAI